MWCWYLRVVDSEQLFSRLSKPRFAISDFDLLWRSIGATLARLVSNYSKSAHSSGELNMKKIEELLLSCPSIPYVRICFHFQFIFNYSVVKPREVIWKEDIGQPKCIEESKKKNRLYWVVHNLQSFTFNLSFPVSRMLMKSAQVKKIRNDKRRWRWAAALQYSITSWDEVAHARPWPGVRGTGQAAVRSGSVPSTHSPGHHRSVPHTGTHRHVN